MSKAIARRDTARDEPGEHVAPTGRLAAHAVQLNRRVERRCRQPGRYPAARPEVLPGADLRPCRVGLRRAITPSVPALAGPSPLLPAVPRWQPDE
jgi:hypothetical protein